MRNLVLGALIGLVTAFIGTKVIGYTSAIAAPHQVFQILGATIGLFVWDTLIVQMLGFGILAFILSYCGVKFFDLGWLPTILFAFATTQIALFFLNGTVSHLYLPLNLVLPHLMVLILAFTIGGYIGSKEKDI